MVTSEQVASYVLTFDGAADTLAGTWDWRETAAEGRLLFTGTRALTGTRVGVAG